MNLEELKLVLETVKTVSGDASTVAIWWIAGKYVLSFITDLVLICTIGVVVLKIAKAIAANNEWAEVGRQVSRAWGAGGGYSFWSEDRQAIDKAIAAAKEQKK